MKLVHLTLFFFIVSLGVQVKAQAFPWEIFTTRTLKDVDMITRKAFRPDDSMFLATKLLETRAEVTFTGESRPISETRKNFIKWWAGSFNYPKDYPDLYVREYLYKEGDDEYWLPTEAPITKYFDKELRPKDKMILYLISIGAYRNKEKVDCVLLVEEYQLPKPRPSPASK